MSEKSTMLTKHEDSLLNFLFDEDYYRSKNYDLVNIEMSYLEHYLNFGWREGRDPSPRFSTSLYLENNKDVSESALCPLWHFVTFGILEGREVYPVKESEGDENDVSIEKLKRLSDEQKLADFLVDNHLANFLFNRDFYLKENKDISESEIDPFFHYFNYGWKEGRDPNEYICTKSYLSQEKVDIAIEPITHYIYFGKRQGLDLFKKGTVAGVSEVYKDLMAVHRADVRKAAYSPHFETPVHRVRDVKNIAMYLPQYHPFKQNDEWWGKGFTEWRNVAKAIPQFEGHYQPRLPGELGYYDLRLKDTFEAQIKLAKGHGVDAFCFHYYWFAGTRLMEKPLDLFLENRDLDIEFCLCWANENWTRRWDGSENDVLIAQEHSQEDNTAVFEDLYKYLSDERYIKVDGKPLIVIYRPAIIPDVKFMISQWRKLAVDFGFKDLHIVCTNAFGFSNYAEMGFDGIVEFPPHDVHAGVINNNLSFHNEDFSGFVYEYDDVVEFCKQRLEKLELDNHGGSYYPTVMTSWDNSARKPGKGNVFHNATPGKFHDWFKYAYEWSKRNHNKSSSFVFINAWNEWAEGTYLEPDLGYGYSWLNAIRTAINESCFSDRKPVEVLLKGTPKNDKAVFVHLHYPDMVNEIANIVDEMKKTMHFDVVVTISIGMPEEIVNSILEKLQPTVLIELINKGRDVFPFLVAIEECQDLNYKIGLKLHSKKSKHLKDGCKWGSSIYESLTNEEALNIINDLDVNKSNVGIVCPKNSVIDLDENSLHHNRENMSFIAKEIFANDYNFEGRSFIAGTMFWFNVELANELVNRIDYSKLFGPELGAIDGTSAHAFERLFLLIAEELEYEVLSYDVQEYYYPY